MKMQVVKRIQKKKKTQNNKTNTPGIFLIQHSVNQFLTIEKKMWKENDNNDPTASA